MGTVHKLEDRTSRLLREISASTGISWGTTVPFTLGRVCAGHIGFAHLPRVGFKGITPKPEALVPVARQHIMRAVREAGLDVSRLGLCVHWQEESRKRKFTDENKASASHGRNKMGFVVRFSLEVPLDLIREFERVLPSLLWG